MKRTIALLFACLMIVTTIPANVAAQDAEPIAFGIEYDYSNLNADIESMIGLDLTEIFQEVMAAGDDAGIDLLIGRVTTGTTTIVFEQYDGDMVTLDVDGTPTDFSTKITELTVRHGVLDDFAVNAEWDDSYAGIELTIGYDAEQLFNADVLYTEYFDANMGLHGMDMEMEIDAMIEYSVGISGELSGDGESLPFDVELKIGTSYEINNGLLEVRMDEPSPVYNEMTNLQPGEQLAWSCNADEGSDSPSTSDDDGEIGVTDQCSERNIHYETATSVVFELTGIPTEELGLPAGDFDISITDSVTDLYDGEVELFFMGGAMKLLDEPSQMITIDDGSTLEVHQAYASPTPLGFPAMWAMMWANSVVGSGDYPTIVDALMGNDNFEEIFGDFADGISGDGDDDEDYFVCANLNEISRDYVYDGYDDCEDNSDEEFWCTDNEGNSWQISVWDVNNGWEDCPNGEDETMGPQYDIYINMMGSSEDEMEFDYEVHGLDYNEDYEVSWTVTNDEGTTSDAGSMAVTDQYDVYNSEIASINGPGEYCIDIEVTRLSDDVMISESQECDSVSRDMEPSDKVITIVEAIGESTLENALEIFGENLENRLSNFEDDFDVAYEDGMAYALFDTEDDRFVGFQVVASPGGTQWYTLIGPQSNAYGTPTRGVSVTYFTGLAAQEEAEVIEDQTELADLVDLTTHNTDEVEAVNEGIDPETLPDDPVEPEGSTNEESNTTQDEVSSLLPFVSPLMTVSIIALAGMFVTIRSKDEE
tara:strand:- start:3479 stop:5761 length:2283 start_codon:yes stop_codon:yes gene_type:complete